MRTDLEKVKSEIRDVMHVQMNDPSTYTDPYMQGLANGMIMIKSILYGEAPEFIDRPRDLNQSNPHTNSQ